MDIVLIGGLWLDGSAWDKVVPALDKLGHRAVPLTLPAAPSATLDDQVAAVLAATDAASGRPVVVGHSAACTLVWVAADHYPERIAATVLLGGFPVADGDRYFSGLEVTDGVIPFPGWAEFEGPDSADLDSAAREAFAASAIPVPEGVARAVVRLADERRFDVPVTVVCPEFSPAQAREWIDAGQIPELARARHVELVDLDAGHWPMFTRPDELARILASVAGQAAGRGGD